jgi:hypothetical protein
MDDYWFLSLILGGSLQDYQALCTWSLFLKVHPLFASASGSVAAVETFALANTTNGNPWTVPQVPYTVSAADKMVLNEFVSLAFAGTVEARYGYPLGANTNFDPHVDPQDWPILGAEVHRWAQTLKTYVWGQGGPYPY